MLVHVGVLHTLAIFDSDFFHFLSMRHDSGDIDRSKARIVYVWTKTYKENLQPAALASEAHFILGY